tara:strand:- start:48 stop:260 length:213 start_codon:yes stop_codon:yes gene_type:complete
MRDIVSIKQAFITLNRFKVKEVVLPYNEYHKLKDIVNLHSNDGGSHNYQERFDEFPIMWIFGVEVKHDGI